MSDPLSERCLYCGLSAVLDDAWFCGALKCYEAYQNEPPERLNEILASIGFMPLRDS